MLQEVVRRVVVQFIPTLFVLSVMIFGFIYLTPGDPIRAMLGPQATPELVYKIRSQYNLDKPFHIQYVLWLKNIVSGDFGKSIRTRQSVLSMVISRLRVTLHLTTFSMILIVFVSIPAGVVASLHPGSFFDRLVMLCTSIAISFPDFFISIVLILLFGVFWRVLPMTDYVSPFEDAVGSITHLIMPSFALAAAYIALLSRLVRSDMLDVINEDFVRTARAKGVSEFKVLFKHSLRNSLLPALNLCTLNFAALLGGSIIIESIFALPGVGRLMIKAIYDRDFPLIQGITLLIGFFFLVSSLIADVSGAIIDPRLRKNK